MVFGGKCFCASCLLFLAPSSVAYFSVTPSHTLRLAPTSDATYRDARSTLYRRVVYNARRVIEIFRRLRYLILLSSASRWLRRVFPIELYLRECASLPVAGVRDRAKRSRCWDRKTGNANSVGTIYFQVREIIPLTRHVSDLNGHLTNSLRTKRYPSRNL